VTDEVQQIVAGRLRTRSEAQVRAREDMASVNADRDQLPKNAPTGTERLRRSLRRP
jgi:hypothetical protein